MIFKKTSRKAWKMMRLQNFQSCTLVDRVLSQQEVTKRQYLTLTELLRKKVMETGLTLRGNKLQGREASLYLDW